MYNKKFPTKSSENIQGRVSYTDAREERYEYLY